MVKIMLPYLPIHSTSSGNHPFYLRNHPPHTPSVLLAQQESPPPLSPFPNRGLGMCQELTNQSATSPRATGIDPEMTNQNQGDAIKGL